MKRILTIIMLVLLVSCVEIKEPIQEQNVFQQEKPKETIQQTQELPTQTVTQIINGSKITYGYSEDGRLLEITGKNKWNYIWEGKLKRITGPINVELQQGDAGLTAATKNDQSIILTYGMYGLTRVDGKEILNIDYDGFGQIRGVRRGVSSRTSFEYHDDGRIRDMTRGQITTTIQYDDKNRVRNIDSDDTKLILGYWRDDKLSSISGKVYGQGLTVSYGPENPPTQATIISQEGTTTFTATKTEALYNAVDNWLYCTQIRRLPILFDGKTYVFYVNYFKKNIAEYIQQEYYCTPYET